MKIKGKMLIWASCMAVSGFLISVNAQADADLVMLDQNLFELPVREISEAQVVQTWFAGKRVYSSKH